MQDNDWSWVLKKQVGNFIDLQLSYNNEIEDWKILIYNWKKWVL